MRLLIYSIQYAPEFTSNGLVITGLARQLAQRGHQVTVLAGTPHYALSRIPPGYNWRLFRREEFAGVRVIRCWAFPRSNGKLTKLLNYASFTFTSLLAGIFVSRPDAVMVVSPPFWLGLTGVLLKFVRRTALIYNAQDLFPEAYLASGEVPSGGLARLMRGLAYRIYHGCDRVTVIAESFTGTIAACGIDRHKVAVIPNYVDTAAVTPLPRDNSFSRQHELTGRFVIMYAGNIGYTHGAELLVEAAAKLSGCPKMLFLVIGSGSKRGDLERLACLRQLANLRFLPTQPREVLPEMLAAADVLVLTSKAGVGRSSFPSRIYNCLLAARPVVASYDQESDLARMLGAAEAGRVTPPGKVDEFCEALMTLYHDPAMRARLGRSGADFMARHYSQDAVVDQYEAVLKACRWTEPNV